MYIINESVQDLVKQILSCAEELKALKSSFSNEHCARLQGEAAMLLRLGLLNSDEFDQVFQCLYEIFEIDI